MSFPNSNNNDVDSISKTNQEGLSAETLHHSHEEADTLLNIHCWEIARRDLFNQCITYCPDTCFPAFDIALPIISKCINVSHW